MKKNHLYISLLLIISAASFAWSQNKDLSKDTFQPEKLLYEDFHGNVYEFDRNEKISKRVHNHETENQESFTKNNFYFFENKVRYKNVANIYLSPNSEIVAYIRGNGKKITTNTSITPELIFELQNLKSKETIELFTNRDKEFVFEQIGNLSIRGWYLNDHLILESSGIGSNEHSGVYTYNIATRELSRLNINKNYNSQLLISPSGNYIAYGVAYQKDQHLENYDEIFVYSIPDRTEIKVGENLILKGWSKKRSSSNTSFFKSSSQCIFDFQPNFKLPFPNGNTYCVTRDGPVPESDMLETSPNNSNNGAIVANSNSSTGYFCNRAGTAYSSCNLNIGSTTTVCSPPTQTCGHTRPAIDFSDASTDAQFQPPILAIAGGLVVFSGWQNPNDQSEGFGQYVKLEHSINGNLSYSIYGHLSSTTVNVGDYVQRGQKIGNEGNTGSSTGEHLHLEYRGFPGNSSSVKYYPVFNNNQYGTFTPRSTYIYTSENELSCEDGNEINNTPQNATRLTQYGKCLDIQDTLQAGLDLSISDEDWYLLGINDLGVLSITLASVETDIFVDLLDTFSNVLDSGSPNNGSVTLSWLGGGNSCLPLYIRIRSNQSNNECIPYSLIINWNADMECNSNQTRISQVLSINGSTDYCEGETVNLTVSGGSGNYSWYLNSELVAQGVSYVENSLLPGIYTITVIDNNTFCDTVSEIVVISEGISANAGSDQTIQLGQSAQLQGSGGSSYSWTPTETLSDPNIFNPIATPTETTTYTLTVSENGCNDTDTVTIIVDGSTGNNSPNDECNNAIVLNSDINCNSINGSVDFATSDPSYSDPSCDAFSNPNANDVFYTFIAQNNTHTITVDPTGVLDAVVTLYNGADCFTLQEFDCEDTPGGNGVTTVLTNNNFIVGEQYWIRIYDYGAVEPPIGEGGFSICITHPDSGGGNGIDLVTNITGVNNNNPNSGETISLDYSATNIGNQPTTTLPTISFFLSANTTLTGNDDFLDAQVILQTIDVNETVNGTIDVTLPNVPDGQYYLVAAIDNLFLIDESNEENNLDFFLIQIGDVVQDGPDLDIKGMTVTPNTNLAPGQKTNVELEIENEGNEDSDGFDVLVFLDINGNGDFDPGEFMREFSFGRLDAGEEKTRDRDMFLPIGITAIGNYDVIAIADSNNEINETNEDNNDKRRNIFINTVNPAGADLIGGFTGFENAANGNPVSELSLCLNENYRLRYFTQNIGNLGTTENTRTRIFISEDQIIDGYDVHFDSDNIGDLDPNEINTGVETEPIEGFSPGNYFLLISTDFNETVQELNEVNNTLSIPITLIDCGTPLPDLRVEILSYSPFSSELGDYLTVDMRITNDGAVAVSNYDLNLFMSEDQVFHGNGFGIEDNGLRDDGNHTFIEPLLPNESINYTMTAYTNQLNYPISEVGIFYLFAVLDSDREISESNKDNNIAIVPIELTSIGCYINFDDEVTSVPYNQTQVFIVEIRTEQHCSWIADGVEDWINHPNNVSGSGNDIISANLQVNELPFSRTGTIEVNDETFTFTQEARPCELLDPSIGMTISVNSLEDIACTNLGAIDVEVNQGFPPYSYSWSNGATSQDLNDINQSGEYTLIVTDVSGCSMEETFTIESSISTTNFVGGAWSNGSPTIDSFVIIDEDYSTLINGGSIEGCTLLVEQNATLRISSEEYSLISNNITVKGTLIIEHEGSLVQIDDNATVLNDGIILVELTTPFMRPKDFMIIGSPMTEETRDGVFGSGYQLLHHVTENFVPHPDVAAQFPMAENFVDDNNNFWLHHAGIIEPGEGYLFRPQPSNADGNATYDIVYDQGSLNNGEVVFDVVFNTSKNDSPNVLSNPYPSAIDAASLISSNDMIDELFFWEHLTLPNSNLPGPNPINFSMEDISMYNLTGGVAAASDPTNIETAPNGVISTGQGFGIKATSSGQAIFNNSMRLTSGNSTLREPLVNDRIWLEVSNSDYEISSSTLLGFSQNTTAGFDKGYDSRRLATIISLYSQIDNTDRQLGIQSREPLEDGIKIPFGFSTLLERTLDYTISIKNIEGIIATDYDVFLVDSELNTITNLLMKDYTFTSVAGTSNGRFTLVFRTKTLDVDRNQMAELVLFPNPFKDSISILFPRELINLSTKITIFDVNGRVIFKDRFNSSKEILSIPIPKIETGTYFINIKKGVHEWNRKLIRQ